jgi:hypothetical protein
MAPTKNDPNHFWLNKVVIWYVDLASQDATIYHKW